MYFITNIVNFVRTKASSMNDPNTKLRRETLEYIMHVHTYCIAQFIIGMRLYKHKVAHHKKRELSY